MRGGETSIWFFDGTGGDWTVEEIVGCDRDRGLYIAEGDLRREGAIDAEPSVRDDVVVVDASLLVKMGYECLVGAALQPRGGGCFAFGAYADLEQDAIFLIVESCGGGGFRAWSRRVFDGSDGCCPKGG